MHPAWIKTIGHQVCGKMSGGDVCLGTIHVLVALLTVDLVTKYFNHIRLYKNLKTQY